MTFPPAYDPKAVEDAIEKRWEASGFFNPDLLKEAKQFNSEAKLLATEAVERSLASAPSNESVTSSVARPFSIVMPPPNATGILHLGHATMLAIEDIMVRYHRMKGDDTLWIPGTDHAAIATQNVVEKELWKTEHKTRHDLGREEFLKRVEHFVEKSKDTIRKQIRKMGASCDWSREAYTLDEQRSNAVGALFVMMYNDGLIYRGKRIVNWCPRCKSTLADDEVEYKEEKTPFYYFKYGPVVIGTARPETKFADKTIVVHPKDSRYKKMVGKEFDVEWIEGRVHANVIADSVIDPKFGSGAMTITPGHSFEDFDIAQRHHLQIHDIIDENGDFTDAAGSFAGKNARSSRAAIVKILKSKGLVDRIDENYIHNLSVCYRCDTPIEPLTKRQWFVDVNKKFRPKIPKRSFGSNSTVSLKDLAIAAVKSGQIKIIPDRFTNVYFHWMNNLRDWCISRQIWFGHRIPVWYCKTEKSKINSHPKRPLRHPELVEGSRTQCDQPIVSAELPKHCPNCGGALEQDPDTLDTWFSSSAWTFTTLGWHNQQKSGVGSQKSESDLRSPTSDLQRFHPTSVLETGYDIVSFWVARMILMTEYALKTVPFKTVYLHGLVRDAQGRKMSKSIGNVIDPLVVAEKFGTDAVRLALVVGTTPGNDVKLSEQKIEGYRNFVNKLWNISRYVSSVPTNYESDTNIRIDANRHPKRPLRHPELVEGSRNTASSTLADRWIISRLQRVIEEVTEHIEAYRFSQAAETLRHFTWDEFADWYIEIAKWQLTSETSKSSTVTQSAIRNPQSNTIAVLECVLATLLKLWHPFMPFVTEHIWSVITNNATLSSRAKPRDLATSHSKPSKDLLLIADWPMPEKKWLNPKAEKTFAAVQTIIREIRSARADFSIPPSAKIAMHLKAPKQLAEQSLLIAHLAKTSIVIPSANSVIPSSKGGSASGGSPEGSRRLLTLHPDIPGAKIHLDLRAYINPEKETARLKKTITETETYISRLTLQLKDKNFLKNAPRDIVSTKKADAAKQETRLKKLREQLQSIK